MFAGRVFERLLTLSTRNCCCKLMTAFGSLLLLAWQCQVSVELNYVSTAASLSFCTAMMQWLCPDVMTITYSWSAFVISVWNFPQRSEIFNFCRYHSVTSSDFCCIQASSTTSACSSVAPAFQADTGGACKCAVAYDIILTPVLTPVFPCTVTC